MPEPLDLEAIRARWLRRKHAPGIEYIHDDLESQNLICADCGAAWPCVIGTIGILVAEVERLRAAWEASRGT